MLIHVENKRLIMFITKQVILKSIRIVGESYVEVCIRNVVDGKKKDLWFNYFYCYNTGYLFIVFTFYCKSLSCQKGNL